MQFSILRSRVHEQSLQISVSHQSGNCIEGVSAPPLGSSQMHLYEFPLTIPESSSSTYSELLSEDERARAAKFRFEKDARRFTVARALMRSILAEYVRRPARGLRFTYSEHGKPSLSDNQAEIRFNLSHAGERAILGVTHASDVGVDIEAIRGDLEFDKLAGRFFSARESNDLRLLSAEKKIQSFFRIWTCKEAFLKAQGFGLSRSLDSFDIDVNSGSARLAATRPDPAEAERWSLVELDTSRDYAAAVVVEGPLRTLSLFRYE